MPIDRLTEEPAESAEPSAAEQAHAPGTGADGAGADIAARRCLMCARWIDEARLRDEPDEVLCVEHRTELTRSRPS